MQFGSPFFPFAVYPWSRHIHISAFTTKRINMNMTTNIKSETEEAFRCKFDQDADVCVIDRIVEEGGKKQQKKNIVL